MSKIKVQEIEHTTSSTPAITIAQNNDVTCNGGLTATSFTGDGTNLTNLPVDLSNLNADNLTSGTVLGDRLPNPLPAIDGSALTGISAGALQHVADYTVPTGTQPSSFVIHPNFNNNTGGANTGFSSNTKYLLRGYISMNSNGGHLMMYPHIWDDSNNTQYGYGGGLSNASSLNTSTHHYGGQTGNQSTSYWMVYEGGYYWERATFELWFTTYNRPHAQSRLFGDTNADTICHGNHFTTSNMSNRRINGLTFTNSWGYSFTDESKLSLYKYSNY